MNYYIMSNLEHASLSVTRSAYNLCKVPSYLPRLELRRALVEDAPNEEILE